MKRTLPTRQVMSASPPARCSGSPPTPCLSRGPGAMSGTFPRLTPALTHACTHASHTPVVLGWGKVPARWNQRKNSGLFLTRRHEGIG